MRHLRSIRVARNISKTQIAEAVGITRQTYARYEEGSRKPNSEVLKKIADFLSVAVNDLFDPEENLSEKTSDVTMEIVLLIEQLPLMRQYHYKQMLENELEFLNTKKSSL